MSLSTILITLLATLRVAFIGDPQVDNVKELEYARKSIYSELRGRDDLDLVVILGDLVNENPSLIAPSEASLDSLSCPWVRINGNHDGPNPKTDTTFLQGGVRFILMNNVRRLKKGGYEGGLREQQKQWLDSVMLASPVREKIIFCTHIPVSQSKGLDSLANITASHDDLLFVCGHTHSVDRHIIERGHEEIIAGAACGTWWRGRKGEGVQGPGSGQDGIPYALMNCGAPRGYFVADINSKTRKNWYALSYKCIAQPYSERYSIRTTSYDDGSATTVINIFGGSREGNVEVKVAGKWVKCHHTYMVAPEVSDIISENASISREYRRAHRDEFIPMRRLPSPHIWTVKANKPVSAIRYSDSAMKFSQKIN